MGKSSMEGKKILLTGHGGCRNRGCEAILRCSIDIFNNYLEPSSINLISGNPKSDYMASINEIGINKIYQSFNYGQRYSLKWVISSISRFLLNGSIRIHLFKYRKIYRETDLLIHIGGDNFCYGGEQVWFDELEFARRLGAITVIWGASIGPFPEKDEIKWARQLKKVDLITVREIKSKEYLKSIGVYDNVKLVADPAFLLVSEDIQTNKVKQDKENGNVIVGLGMSNLVSRYDVNQNRYMDSFYTFAKKLLENDKVKILLIPHVYDSETRSDDFDTCEELYKRLDSERAFLFLENYNACQIKSIIKSCDYFIGARTHSTIASISLNIPTISIAYSTKAYGLNKTIFGHTDYVIPIAKISHEILFEKYYLLIKNRNEVIEKLNSMMDIIKIMANDGGLYLKSMLIKNSIEEI